VLLAGLVTLMSAASASAALSWRWGPNVIPTNLAVGAGFISISCPSTSLCAAGDDVGHVAATANPFHGTRAWPSVYRDPGDGNITDIACPSSSLCVAVDTNGFVLASANPTAAGSWKRFAIDPGFFAQGGQGQLDTVSCPSVSECVAFDYSDYRLWVSADPIAGSWTAVQLPQHDASSDPFNVDMEPQFTAASCGAATSCVAFNNSGNELASSAPAVPASWHVLPGPKLVLGHDPDTGAAIRPATLRCPSATVCVAAGVHTSGVATTANADGGGTAWQVTRLYPGTDIDGNPADGPLEPAVACAGPSFCIAYDNRPLSSQALVWTLAGYRGRPHWSRAIIRIRGSQDGTDLLRKGACPSSSACVFTDNNGYAYFGTPGRPTHVRCVVPKLKGLTVARARQALTRSHCRLGKITGHRKGRVRSQHPKKGSRLPAGAAVSIVVR
jgi:hypothetical protein